MLELSMMAQLAKDQLLQNLTGAGPFKADDLMRSRSADSIMASEECPSSQQQAGYMYTSPSRCSLEESSCIRGGSIYAPMDPPNSKYQIPLLRRKVKERMDRSKHTIYAWKAKYGAEVNEAEEVKEPLNKSDLHSNLA
jgi:hypothetical protein